jgi:hypothetical protein
MFVVTRHGWWTPILGAAVGAGVAWSLQKVSSDKRAENFLTEQKDVDQTFRIRLVAVARILRLVLTQSWRIMATLALGGILVYYLLNPGPGICDISDPQWTKASCDQAITLAPKSIRVAGIVLIIWAGGIFLETGILFGIFAARTGVKLNRDDDFLRSFSD